ncbi:DUF2180 family protein [Streptomyces oceani]|uniref:DUF2180 family protein n=1 Tax=Streptomyces oceani TaxID=1075402 RepID=UPI0009A107AF
MHCLDCHGQGKTGDAVGVCQSCGAAVCEQHAHLGVRRVRRGPLMGAPLETEVRKVLCSGCTAVQAPVPGTAPV